MMKPFLLRLAWLIFSVIFPVMLVGLVLGWDRRVGELNQAATTFAAILLLLTMSGAFFAGYNLARNKSAHSVSEKNESSSHVGWPE